MGLSAHNMSNEATMKHFGTNNLTTCTFNPTLSPQTSPDTSPRMPSISITLSEPSTEHFGTNGIADYDFASVAVKEGNKLGVPIVEMKAFEGRLGSGEFAEYEFQGNLSKENERKEVIKRYGTSDFEDSSFGGLRAVEESLG